MAQTWSQRLLAAKQKNQGVIALRNITKGITLCAHKERSGRALNTPQPATSKARPAASLEARDMRRDHDATERLRKRKRCAADLERYRRGLSNSPAQTRRIGQCVTCVLCANV